MAIESPWENYFKGIGEGLGTTYERFILHRYFERLREEFDIENVLESPSFGITGLSGINSLWWATHDIPVTLVDENERRLELIKELWSGISVKGDFLLVKDYGSLPFKQKRFDMSWTFCGLGWVQNLNRCLEELTRVTRRVIFICLPNKWGLGYRVRYGFRKDRREGPSMKNGSPGKITAIMNPFGWECRDRGHFDVPPWPDIAMKKEEFLKKLGLGWFSGMLMKRDCAGISILDYFKGDKDMERRIMKYSFLENSPAIFKKFWAHHEYLLFSPKES